MTGMQVGIPRLKADSQCAAAVDLARQAAVAEAGLFGVGDSLGYQAEAERVVSHLFACPHPGYRGWFWSVTVTRALRSKVITVNEVVLLPDADALVAPTWIPWAERATPEDLAPGMLQPAPSEDPWLEPGFTGGEAALTSPAVESSVLQAVVAELGLGRERVLSPAGRDAAADRWHAGPGGPDNEMSTLAPARCLSCGYLIRLSGLLGEVFGVCANERAPADGSVVAVDHGCGAHSDVVIAREAEAEQPVWDTISVDTLGE